VGATDASCAMSCDEQINNMMIAEVNFNGFFMIGDFRNT
jgi:hypothetical protein